VLALQVEMLANCVVEYSHAASTPELTRRRLNALR
jgi:hypothetical protein